MSLRIESIAGDTKAERVILSQSDCDEGGFVEEATYDCEIYTDADFTTLQETLAAAKSWNGGLMFSPTAGMVAATYYIRIKQTVSGIIGTIGSGTWVVK